MYNENLVLANETIMQKHREIKHFVQETLGCSCPEEVFNKIDYDKELTGSWERRVNVGNRLLIYIINTNSVKGLSEKIITALRLGVSERNSKGFNRFRLVLASSKVDEIRVLATKEFHESLYYDEKTHLHIVTEEDIAQLDDA